MLEPMIDAGADLERFIRHAEFMEELADAANEQEKKALVDVERAMAVYEEARLYRIARVEARDMAKAELMAAQLKLENETKEGHTP